MQSAQAIGTDAYLDAFMNGFEFVLLAIRGRLNEGALPADERARLEGFLADYARIVSAYQERRQEPASKSITAAQSFRQELEPISAN